MSKGEQLAGQWLGHRAVLIDILGQVDDSNLDFRPWSKAMTLRELVLHITGVADMFIETVKAGAFTPPARKLEAASMAELRQLVQEYTDKNYEDIKSMTDEVLERPFKAERIFTTPTPGKVWLAAMKEHEIHHKGQMFVYARMVGVEDMPSFVKRNL